jgi:hypothetical protein
MAEPPFQGSGEMNVNTGKALVTRQSATPCQRAGLGERAGRRGAACGGAGAGSRDHRGGTVCRERPGTSGLTGVDDEQAAVTVMGDARASVDVQGGAGAGRQPSGRVSMARTTCFLLPAVVALLMLAACGSQPASGNASIANPPAATAAPPAAAASATSAPPGSQAFPPVPAATTIANNATDVQACQMWRTEQADGDNNIDADAFDGWFMGADEIGSTMDQNLANTVSDWYLVLIGHPGPHPLSYYVSAIDADCQSIGQ